MTLRAPNVKTAVEANLRSNFMEFCECSSTRLARSRNIAGSVLEKNNDVRRFAGAANEAGKAKAASQRLHTEQVAK
jgi:hypothetical protein